MPIDQGILDIKLMFGKLTGPGSASSFPSIMSLSNALNGLVRDYDSGSLEIDNKLVSLFATASVEAWQRGLHSFLISASMTDASPMWSSVAGYYSSHYVMRAFAHLFGYFQLFQKKVIVHLDLSGSKYYIDLSAKGAGDREHRVYWKIVHLSKFYKNDPFFYANIDTPPPIGSLAEFMSDGGHRNRANYADHVGRFPVFHPLDETALQRRIVKLSGIELNDPPIPNVSQYPDIDSVQLIAYHRILKYRSLLDNILSTKRGFWAMQRDPSWRPPYFDFQVVGADYSGFVKEFL